MMQVRKRDGSFEDVKLEKITSSVKRVCEGLGEIDYGKIAFKTVGGLYDGVSTAELDELSIQTAVGFISIDPLYSKVAARLLANYVHKEVTNQDVHSFSQSIKIGYEFGLIGQETFDFVQENRRKLNNAIDRDRSYLFEYYGLRVIYDRYLLKNPETRDVFETPQYFLLRVACGLADSPKEAIEFYNTISSLEYMASTPTLFNSGTSHPQMSSCYLLDSPMDDLIDIEKRRSDIAMLSKWAGGIGVSYSRVRESGALIKGTNGRSNGIIPFVHALDANVAAVNQGGKRKGAAAVYLDTSHPDLMEFLELRDNTGDQEKRSYNLNLANWIPDLFMQRVLEGETDENGKATSHNGLWSFFSPNEYPELNDIYGKEFENRYLELEADEKFVKQLPARKIYARMMRTLAETGNGWMCWKDTSNIRGNSSTNGNVIHSSNLCTEILEPNSSGKYAYVKNIKETDVKKPVISGYENGQFKIIEGGETAVCNLGSINLAFHVKDGKLDKLKLRKNVAIAIKFLDKVIDRNYYPIPEAFNSNKRWRPVGIGLMGFQDFLFQLRIPFDSEEATRISAEIQEEIYYSSLKTSNELAKELGPHSDFKHTRAAKGELHFDLVGVEVADKKRWDALKEEIKEHGLRNSLLVSIAPTVTISAICGVYECIEPQMSNLFKRETLSGEFVTVNKYLVEDLKKIDLWNETMLSKIKTQGGSIQNIMEIPEEFRVLYKTVWEVKQKNLINHAVARGAFIDQSQSLNLFVESPTIDKLSSMYMYCWQQGLKTTYYLRSKAATKIQQVSGAEQVELPPMAPENPDICESCT